MEIGTKVIVTRINPMNECFSESYLGKVGTLIANEKDWQPYNVQFDVEGEDTIWFYPDEIEEYKPVQPEEKVTKLTGIRNLRIEKVSDGYDVCFSADINIDGITTLCTIPFLTEQNAVRTMQKIKEQIL